MNLTSGPASRPYLNTAAPYPPSRQSRINWGRDKLQLSFAGSKPEANPPNVLKRVWQWIKNLPERLANFLRKLFHIQQPPPYVSTLPPKSTKVLYSHIDPKLTNDPGERRRITAQIADECFEKVITLIQNRTVKQGPDGRDVNWNDLAGQVLTPVAQKLLNTNTELGFSYHDTPGMGLGMYCLPEKHVNGPGSSREELGKVIVTRPHYLQYDFSNPAHRQAFYGPFIHELHHMTRYYALDHSVESLSTAHKHPAKNDPLDELYTKAIISPSIGGVPTVLTGLLAEENPHLSKDIKMDFGTAANQMKASTIQSYWEPLQKTWERTDFPLLNRAKPVKQRFDELLDKGDPAIIKEMIEDNLVDELESYMTCLRKPPGVPKDKLQPTDFTDLGAAMFLRDMIRYYYQHPKHLTPASEQHPLTQIRPLKTLLEEYNA